MNSNSEALGLGVVMEKARNGDAEAQCMLGNYYDNMKDFKNAAIWFKTAAIQGNAQAQFNLGAMIQNGDAEDERGAIYWLTKAAEQGYGDAQGYLGLIYSQGAGVIRDETIAFYWYEKAAWHGEPMVQKIVGDCYYQGRGVERDIENALRWYKMAADQGDEDAEYAFNLAKSESGEKTCVQCLRAAWMEGNNRGICRYLNDTLITQEMKVCSFFMNENDYDIVEIGGQRAFRRK
jgi:TPR repeat protein